MTTTNKLKTLEIKGPAVNCLDSVRSPDIALLRSIRVSNKR